MSKMETKTVKSISFRAKLKGQGIVNFDGDNQKQLFKSKNNIRDNFKLDYQSIDGTSFGKKSFFINENNQLDFKIKISGDCLRNGMFKSDYIATNPNILGNNELKYAYLASIPSILRGYVNTEKNGENTKKAGVFTICDAIQTNNSLSFVETRSRTGEKTTDENKSDNTFFSEEKIGHIEYETEGIIDLTELQFVSCSQKYGRFGFNPDYINQYSKYLKLNIPNFSNDFGYFQFGNTMMIPEHGLKFSEENVVFLTKELLKRVLSINIRRKTSFAKLYDLEIKLNSSLNDNNEWIKIEDFNDIEKLNFDVYCPYIKIDTEKAEEILASIEEYAVNKKENNKKEKEAKKKNKEDKNPKIEE